jgi:carboxylesterase type B
VNLLMVSPGARGLFSRAIDDDRRIGDLLSSYWVNFARTADLNGPGLPPWEPFTDARQRMLRARAATSSP